MAHRTAWTHRTSFVRDTFQIHIVRYSAGVARSARSSAYHAGGHTWALICGFGDHGHLTSISLELLTTDITKDVIAIASLRIDDPHGQRPPAVWRSDVANVFPAWPTTSAMATCRTWKLSLPDAFRGHEASYLKDDGLMIQCTIDVVVDQDCPSTAQENIVSVVPPPSISQDLRNLLLLEESGTESQAETTKSRNRCLMPDVTFLVEEAEIQAHKLVLAMRSPVFAAQLFTDKQEATKDTCLKVVDMTASTFRAMLRFIYTDELPIKHSNKATFTSRACKEKFAARRRAAMARDLLVAAERYKLEKLSRMCQNILSDNSDAMPTLTIDRGRQSRDTSSCIVNTAASIMVVPSPSIVAHLGKLLVSEDWSDVMFLVEETRICAHRLIIAARSHVLHELVLLANKDHHNVVRIHDMKAATFKVILHFIYTDELPPIDDDLLIGAAGDLVMVAGDLLIAACRFRLERMKAMCENFLAGSITKENVLSMLKRARRHNCPDLQDYCIEFIKLPLNTKDVINLISYI